MRRGKRSAEKLAATRLLRDLERVRSEILRLERLQPLSGFGARRASARNLVDYLALRRFDARPLQDELARLGLSSLGRSESHVRGNLDSVLRMLGILAGRRRALRPLPPKLDLLAGRERIEQNALALLGRPSDGRRTRIMVTVPTEAATDPALTRQLVDAGMDCMRINCAHDSPEVWSGMIANLRTAESRTGRRCRVEIDLGGPRLRTGPMEPGPAVVRTRPTRNPFGRVVRPAQLWLRATPPQPADRTVDPPVVRVPSDWLAARRLGSVVELTDSRGSSRSLRVVEVRPDAVLLVSENTVYVADGTELRGGPGARGRRASARASVAAREGVACLKEGDTVRLVAGEEIGRSERRDPSGRVRSPARLPILPSSVLPALRRGHRVWFDGGRAGGLVRSTGPRGAVVTITHARPGGTRLGVDKGLNLPDTPLAIPSLTPKDLVDLDFIVAHADIVGYSFVQSAADVRGLRRELLRRGAPNLGVVLKVETRRAFDRLPEILLAALRCPVAGVMIARGDLAVEVGYERLAEVQEEILWLSESAHLPAIWATQVLEGLTKTGLPSRAEVTDAAMGSRAECVMLNKGPHLVEAVRALDSILRRMEAHQAKKSARLRHLRVAENFFEPPEAAPARTRPPPPGGSRHRDADRTASPPR